MPRSSAPEDEDGGDVYSLKVVRASLREAALCIWSSASASISLLTCEVLDMDVIDPRRARSCGKRGLEAEALSPSAAGLAVMIAAPVRVGHGSNLGISGQRSAQGESAMIKAVLGSAYSIRRDAKGVCMLPGCFCGTASHVKVDRSYSI